MASRRHDGRRAQIDGHHDDVNAVAWADDSGQIMYVRKLVQPLSVLLGWLNAVFKSCVR